ncbi:aromatic ring-hydroxylating dioxygenase subunit alpha [Streptomyces sp. NPDC093707]|uniref:aromatic ring-hydroxylating dioxygenase subunit alpha n=1 Tax=Streptomyces sp. NPDC093707 TaxID=3154984 RepID=UPI00344FF812
MPLSTSDTADHIYATGLRNQWHPVLPSSAVAPGAMRTVTALGEQWLLFRRADGTPALLADRCPHRGAPLSLGKHLGDRVACGYHGIEVATDGTVSSVPGLPGCHLEGRKLVPSLPVREVAGAILAYFGDDAHPEPVELTVPDPLDDPGIEPILCHAQWNAPWRCIMENLLDPMHGAFLHRESHSLYDGDTTATFRVRGTDRGYVFEKTDQRGVNFDWVELCRTGVDWVDLSIPYPPSAGPGGPFGIVGMLCPVDAERTGVFFWRYRRVQGWQRDTWRFLYKTLIEERHWEVLEQDRIMLEALPADADRHENLYQHDLGVVRLRRLYRAQAERQAAAAPPR